jgi:hypothetical protein
MTSSIASCRSCKLLILDVLELDFIHRGIKRDKEETRQVMSAMLHSSIAVGRTSLNNELSFVACEK